MAPADVFLGAGRLPSDADEVRRRTGELARAQKGIMIRTIRDRDRRGACGGRRLAGLVLALFGAVLTDVEATWAQRVPGCLAQPAAPVHDGAATITAAALIRHAVVFAHDSFRHPTAPGAALERTARYIAEQFQRLGLAPGGDYGRDRSGRDRLQRYLVAGRY